MPTNKKAIDYGKIDRDVVKFFGNNKERFYLPGVLVRILGLDVSSYSLNKHLSERTCELGITSIHDERSKTYYGKSEICDSGTCWKDWCNPENMFSRCKLTERNPELEFIQRVKQVR